MSRLLDGVARRLAADTAVSRRDLITARRAASSSDQAAHAPPLAQPANDPAAHASARPAPTAADRHTINAALKRALPARSEVLALVDALKLPSQNGHISHAAIVRIGHLRSGLRAAHRRIAAIGRHSSVRADALTAIADTDRIFANLVAIGQTNDLTRVAQLRSQSATLERRADAAARRAGRVLSHSSFKAGTP
jgi:hypothetical protein